MSVSRWHRKNTKSKTLATLGEGNVTIRDDAESGENSLESLNRDLDKTDKELFSSNHGMEVQATIDTRLLTKDGRNQIKEDIKRTELLIKAVGDTATEESVQIKDMRQHIGDLQRELDVQEALARQEGGKHAQTLNNPNATPEQKQAALNAYASVYSDIFGISIEDARVIAVKSVNQQGNMMAGIHYTNDGGSVIVINDNAQDNGLTYANALGHEVTHAQVAQDTIRDRGDSVNGRNLNEEYSYLRGSYAEDLYGFSFSQNDLGDLNTGNSNQHIGNDTSELLQDNIKQTVDDRPQRVDYAFYGFDGTGADKDASQTDNDSNVAKLHDLYEGVKFYLPGVGTNEENGLANFLGNTSGLHGDKRVKAMYQHLIHTYNGVDEAGKPLPGGADTDIDIAGFSRGAALAREFAHYINEHGIPDINSARTVTVSGGRTRRTKIVYDRYLVEPGSLDSITRRIDTGRTIGDTPIMKIENQTIYQPNDNGDPIIRSMSIFDTVGSFGQAGDNDEGNKELSITPNTQTVRHAISAKENRDSFPLSSAIDPTNPNDSRIKEQVFEGVHTDVGGSYPEGALANDPLYWMVTEMQQAGVPYKTPEKKDLPVGPDSDQRIEHNEFEGEKRGRWMLFQRVTSPIEYRNTERQVFYYQNPASIFDTNHKSNPEPADIEGTKISEHKKLMEEIGSKSSQPLIYPEFTGKKKDAE